ncbi:MAG: hypothetical protein V1872_14615 [bacterium]
MEAFEDTEQLSRYILSESQFSKTKSRVKYSAFMPASDGKTSVFRIYNLTENEIWEIGENEVAQKRDKALLARADIKASHILKTGLSIIPDDSPPRHANIDNWPSEKERQRLIALELAEESSLFLK